MESRSSSPPSLPSSPPASLLIETIDYRDTIAQSVDEPSGDLPPPSSTSSLPDRLDPVDNPYDLGALALSLEESSHDLSRPVSPATTDRTITLRNFAGTAQPASSPTPTNSNAQHPFGILNSVHLHLRIGRDLTGDPNIMEPAPPARIVQRNDFNWTPPNGDPKDNITAAAADNFLGDAMKPTFPPKLEGVAKARQKSEAKTTEDLAGLGPELEALVLAKREYTEKFGAFRKRWTKVQFALADKAKKMRGRVVGAELRPIVGAIGVMFALGKAVDFAAFPGSSFGEFDEEACSPEGYLSELFPELSSGPLTQWDFSLSGIMALEKRNLLPDLWAAAVAGQWKAVDEMTSGVLAVAEELLGGV